jgi:GntR family transcriptional regulator
MARFRLEHGPIPLHHQVYVDLRAALDAGEWDPGDRMPSERELAVRYGCSVITIRHALGELAREQRVKRTRGRGTYVIRQRIDRDFAGALSFAEEMQRRGFDPDTRVVTSLIEPAGDRVARALGIPLRASVVYLERLRLADGEPLLLEQVYLSAERFPGLLGFDLEHNSLYDLLAERFGVRVVRSREAIEPALLRAREARLLGRGRRTPALLVEGTAFDAEGEPVEVARSYVVGDRTRYFIERMVTRESWEQRRVVAPLGRGTGEAAPVRTPADELTTATPSGHPKMRRNRHR